MLTFSNKHWTDEIAEASEEFQNAVIRIWDPSLVERHYDVPTGEWVIDNDGTVYPTGSQTGQARVLPIRWNVNHEGSHVGNSSAWTAVQVQLPKGALGRVKRGMRMTVVECEDNPALLSYLFTINSGLQGSNAATRTIEFAVDGDAVMPGE